MNGQSWQSMQHAATKLIHAHHFFKATGCMERTRWKEGTLKRKKRSAGLGLAAGLERWATGARTMTG